VLEPAGVGGSSAVRILQRPTSHQRLTGTVSSGCVQIGVQKPRFPARLPGRNGLRARKGRAAESTACRSAPLGGPIWPAVVETESYLLRYTSVLKYVRPESAISVTTLALGPSRSATRIAATTFALEDVPANNVRTIRENDLAKSHHRRVANGIENVHGLIRPYSAGAAAGTASTADSNAMNKTQDEPPPQEALCGSFAGP
jgi:hypothetical protein